FLCRTPVNGIGAKMGKAVSNDGTDQPGRYEDTWGAYGNPLLDGRANQNHANAGDEKHDGKRGRNLHGLFFLHRGFDRSDLCHLFLFVIAEVWMRQPEHATNHYDYA